MTPGPAKLRLLVVDDDEVDRLAVRRALQDVDARAEIVEARNVQEALSCLADGDFDCALVDFHLPDGDGFDVLASTSDREGAPPVIMLTGQGDERLAVQLMRQGASDYLTKGEFDAARLMRSLRYVTGSRRARDQERSTAALHELLASAGALFARSLDLDETLATVTGLFVPRLADGCRVRLEVLDAGSAIERCVGSAPSDPQEDPGRSLSLSLVGRGEDSGVIELYRDAGREPFSEEHVMLAGSLADRAAAALENARLYRDLREESDTVTTLNRLGEALAAQLDSDDLIRTVVTEATRLTNAQYGSFVSASADPDRGRSAARVHARDGAPPIEAVGGAEIAALLGRVEGGIVRHADLTSEAGAPPPTPFDSTGSPPLRSYLAVPVRGSDGSQEAALVFAHSEPGVFTRRSEEMATGVARWAGIALDNARLFRDVQAAVQARDDVIAIVSHDLRNPVNVVLSAASLLEELELDAAARSKQLRVIQRAGRGMNRLIQDLLDVSRIEANRLAVERVPTELSRVFSEVHDLMMPLADDRGVTLIAESSGDGVSADLDASRIVQVFSNLIGNALKFTPAGGTVRYGVEVRERELEFRVTDTGPGIPSEQVPHLFDRFWQGGRASREGAGLGLPIARGIVEAHAGRMSVDTSEGSGTTFSFSIPRSVED